MSITAIVSRLLTSIAGALLPKVKQLYAERSAGKVPEAVPVDHAEKILDEALIRLGAVDVDQPWWKLAVMELGAAAIRPDWFKKPHVQEWLSQTDAQRLLKVAAKAKLTGVAVHRDDYEALVASYMLNSHEDRQHAESVITLAVAVLKASIIGAVRDPGTAAIVQANATDHRELMVAMNEQLKAIGPVDLDKLTELAKSYANLIPDDVGGTQLDRTSLLETLNAKLTMARLVQVRGLPGSGNMGRSSSSKPNSSKAPAGSVTRPHRASRAPLWNDFSWRSGP
jgi:hypothetical protein